MLVALAVLACAGGIATALGTLTRPPHGSSLLVLVELAAALTVGLAVGALLSGAVL